MRLYSVIGIPFVLSLWTPFAIEFSGDPVVKVNGQALEIHTDDAAGGFAYFLDQPIPLTDEKFTVAWNWKISQHPKTKHVLPLTKDREDFALRVGLLISDGEKRIPLPGKFARAIKQRNEHLSYVIFYCATPEKKLHKKCQLSPFSDKVVDCFQRAEMAKSRKVTVRPSKEYRRFFKNTKKAHVFGVWLFADSDNSESKTGARIANLTVSKK